jgi:hypothetical protein
VLLKADDPRLPPPPGEPQGIREVIWGVDGECTLHCRDVTGYTIGFTLANVTPLQVARRSANSPDNVERYSEGVKAYERAKPTRLIHLAMDIPGAGHDAAKESRRLGRHTLGSNVFRMSMAAPC